MKLIPLSEVPDTLRVRAQHRDHQQAVECDCGCVFVPERVDTVTCPKCETTEVLKAPDNG